jgi:putative ABC transport system substrate-binding protein
MMDRRAFLGALAGGLLAAPLAGEAQQTGKMWRIGLFHVGLDHVPPSLAPLRQALRELGYEDGINVLLDWRNLANADAAVKAAGGFVQDRVDLIVAFENQTTRAAKAATSTIPIVFLHVTDPVADGFVKTLARPGGNLTGFSGIGDIPSKEVEILKEAVPGLRRILVLVNPRDPVTSRRLAEMKRAATRLQVTLIEREATDAGGIERTFSSVTRRDVDGVVVASPDLRLSFSSLTIRFATEKHLPLYVHRKEWVERGGLVSYAPDLAAVGPLAAQYVDRVLKGASPTDLPVQEFSQYKLVINLKTAKALGLTIPPAVLARADEVIQ